MNKELLLAAQAVLDRWDSPQWEWTKNGPTGDLMHALKLALAQPVPSSDDLVTRESAMGAIDYLSLSNAGSRAIDAENMLVTADIAQAAVAAERERCALVCKNLYTQGDHLALRKAGEDCAAAIRQGDEPRQPDTERLDWLDKNIFHRELTKWDSRLDPNRNMWVMFAPKGHQGTARRIIDAAMTEAKESK